MKNFEDENIERLFNAVLSLNTKEECHRFFEDLCTISEIKSMAQRLQVALLLSENNVYTDIVKKTGASSATISRVNKCYNYGAGGYKTVLERVENHE